jgi:hypothetical protein
VSQQKLHGVVENKKKNRKTGWPSFVREAKWGKKSDDFYNAKGEECEDLQEQK